MLVDLGCGLQDLEDALLGEGRRENDVEVGEGSHALADSVLEVLNSGIALVLHEVPFVDDHDEPFLVALNELVDVEVLRLDASSSVEHEDADIRVLDSADAAHDTVKLKVLADLRLAADTRGVDEQEVEAELLVVRIDAVARSAGDIGDDVALLADEGVGEAALAYVGASHDSDARQVELVLNLVGLRQFLQHEVEKVARAAARSGADAERVTEAEAVEVGCEPLLVAVVSLISNKDDGFRRTAKDAGYGLVEVGDSRIDVHEEEDDVGLLSGEGHLLADFLLEDVVAIHDPSTGVDDGELTTHPLALAVLAVARGTCLLGDDGVTGFGQAVEESGLAYIGASYDGYEHYCKVKSERMKSEK